MRRALRPKRPIRASITIDRNSSDLCVSVHASARTFRIKCRSPRKANPSVDPVEEAGLLPAPARQDRRLEPIAVEDIFAVQEEVTQEVVGASGLAKTPPYTDPGDLDYVLESLREAGLLG